MITALHVVRRSLNLFTIILPLVLSAQLALADGGGVMGKVAERTTGKPVVGARVSLSQSTPNSKGGKGIAELQSSADSDLSGNYVLNDVPPANYVMVIQADGYSPGYQKNVQVTSGQTLSVDVALDRRP